MTSPPPRRWPKGDQENPIPPSSPPPPSPDKTPPSKPQTPTREEDADPASPPRSPLPPPSNGPAVQPPPQSSMAIVIANRLSREADVSASAKVVGGRSSGPRRGDRGLGFQPAVARWPRREKAAAAGLRVAALVLCMIAFSVMASDKTEGWAGDSFNRYIQFRYLVAVNVIGFVYSLFQVYEHIHHSRMTVTHIMSHQMRYYFDFSMDQILAYLLMSTSSAAASCNDVWVSRFGNDGFTRKANASIVTSFLAFIVFALSSIISAYDLFRLTS